MTDLYSVIVVFRRCDPCRGNNFCNLNTGTLVPVLEILGTLTHVTWSWQWTLFVESLIAESLFISYNQLFRVHTSDQLAPEFQNKNRGFCPGVKIVLE